MCTGIRGSELAGSWLQPAWSLVAQALRPWAGSAPISEPHDPPSKGWQFALVAGAGAAVGAPPCHSAGASLLPAGTLSSPGRLLVRAVGSSRQSTAPT